MPINPACYIKQDLNIYHLSFQVPDMVYASTNSESVLEGQVWYVCTGQQLELSCATLVQCHTSTATIWQLLWNLSVLLVQYPSTDICWSTSGY